MWKLKLHPRGKEEGALAVYMTGGGIMTELYIANQRITLAWNFTPQNITGIKIYGYPQNYELNISILIYSFKQTFLTHDFGSIR